MFNEFPITNSKRQTIVGLIAFGVAFWITRGMFGKLGAELERVCEIVERIGDRCRTGADLSLLFWLATFGCIAIGYVAYRLSHSMFTPKP
ncbi:hypothetical protein MUO32_26130 [Shinella sp. CPCC 101442]|uniref:hypothetical protein n=1 Tax=Shinella sp. CPCC 101442 TaxID=2932265 RepID=UPI0021523F9C|nr:hypothetical protein [Shinella sp. CPCC 101442]MCR6502511.1 hypothetical protein [Shinella sp. CPCC 101442]